MNEYERPYHPLAQLFPMLDGDDYERDTGMMGIYNGGVVFINPSTHDYHYFVSRLHGDSLEELGKPIKTEGIKEIIAFMGIDFDLCQWITTRSKPGRMSPFWVDPKPKTPDTELPPVYFISGLDLIKIGVGYDPPGRMNDIQRMSPAQLHLIGTVGGGFPKERELHCKFSHLRTHGEWFRAAPELLNYIKENAQ